MTLATKAIDIAEAAYDLECAATDWLPNVLKAAEDVFDLGFGAIAMVGAGFREDGQGALSQIATSDGKPDLAMALMAAVQELGSETIRELTAARMASPVIEQLSLLRSEQPVVYETYARHLGCKDVISLHCHDPDGYGALISMPSKELQDPSTKTRELWERVAVHIATGYRLRRRLGAAASEAIYAATDLPLDAEALLDPTRFLVKGAIDDTAAKAASTTIREAAVRVDRARGRLRKEDPEEALRIWRAMVRGRWSLVDWFDTDGRRFVLAKPNAPDLGDPRGLSEREHQVVTYASHGESSKLIGYRLGLSSQRVSALLKSGMHKLGVKTQAQLVEKLRGLPNPLPSTEQAEA